MVRNNLNPEALHSEIGFSMIWLSEVVSGQLTVLLLNVSSTSWQAEILITMLQQALCWGFLNCADLPFKILSFVFCLYIQSAVQVPHKFY